MMEPDQAPEEEEVKAVPDEAQGKGAVAAADSLPDRAENVSALSAGRKRHTTRASRASRKPVQNVEP